MQIEVLGVKNNPNSKKIIIIKYIKIDTLQQKFSYKVYGNINHNIFNSYSFHFKLVQNFFLFFNSFMSERTLFQINGPLYFMDCL